MARANCACALNKFCFCVDLRTGSFLIGYANLIWSVIVALFIIVFLYITTYYIPTDIIIIMVFNLGLTFIRLIFVILLLVGLHQNNHQFVFIFLICGVALTLAALVLCIVSLFLGDTVVDEIVTLCDIGINVYFLVVIRSYYLKMDRTITPQFPMQLQPAQYTIQPPPQNIVQQPPPYAMNQAPPYLMQTLPQHNSVNQQQPQLFYQPQQIDLQQQQIDLQQQQINLQQQQQQIDLHKNQMLA